MQTINNVPTQDKYVDALTLGPTPTCEKIVYLVANAGAIVQFANWRNDKTIEPWGPEILVTPTTGEIQRVQGMRFRSAVSGSPAQVVAQLIEPGDVIPVGGTPFTNILTASGGIVIAGNITAGPFNLGPPTNPNNGDIWIGTGVDGVGTAWMFRFNAGSASGFKWEFIGGPPTINPTPNGNGWAANAWNDLGGGYTIQRNGDYIFECSVSGQNSAAGAQSFELGVGHNSTTSVNRILAITTQTAGFDIALAGWDWIPNCAINERMWLNGLANGAGAPAPSAAQFTVLPVRII